MYKKVWCTCEIVVSLIKPIVFWTFSLSSASLDLKVPIRHIIDLVKDSHFTLARHRVSISSVFRSRRILGSNPICGSDFFRVSIWYKNASWCSTSTKTCLFIVTLKCCTSKWDNINIGEINRLMPPIKPESEQQK